jgi:hypothetical protein
LLSDVRTFFDPTTQEVVVMVRGGCAEVVCRKNEEEAPHRRMEHGGRAAGESRCGGGKSIAGVIGVYIFLKGRTNRSLLSTGFGDYLDG